MSTDFASNRAAWLIAGFLGRKVMKDLLGRWSLIPILAVGLCFWTKWKSRKQEIKAGQNHLDQLRSRARQQLHELHLSKLKRVPTSSGYTFPTRRVGGPCGGFTTSLQSSSKEDSGTRNCSVDSAWSSLGDVAAAWLGGGGGRVYNGERSRGRGGDSGGEWRGAFTNRMGGIPRRNAFKTARGKVYIRSGDRRSRWGGGESGTRTIGGLESVREEDEGTAPS